MRSEFYLRIPWELEIQSNRRASAREQTREAARSARTGKHGIADVYNTPPAFFDNLRPLLTIGGMIAVQEDLRTILAANIRQRRRELGMTQADLALRLDVSQPYIVKVEKGRVSTGLDQLARLAEALEVDAASLLTANIISPSAA